MDHRCGPRDRTPALQAQSIEFKSQFRQNKKKMESVHVREYYSHEKE
jgi:hypothetical protein